jgi:hypothetical protein
MDAEEAPTPGDVCPLCGNAASFRTAQGEASPVIAVHCAQCGDYRVAPDDAVAVSETRMTGGTAFAADTLHLLSGYTREMTIMGGGGVLLSPENARAMAAAAPRSIPERADRLLLNVAGLSEFAGQRIQLDYGTDYVLSFSTHGGETAFLMDHLIAEGLVDREPGLYSVVAVSVHGWGRVEALRAPGSSHRQGFVAMSFEPDLLDLYDDAIAPAITDAGYDPFVIAGHEHTGQIDDTILLELNRSRFVVAEFTATART